MENLSEDKVPDIRERVLKYALRSIKLYQYVEKEAGDIGKILGKQYLRAATSIGANVEEAQASESRNDFIHKLSVSCKEARESLYWVLAYLIQSIRTDSRDKVIRNNS